MKLEQQFKNLNINDPARIKLYDTLMKTRVVAKKFKHYIPPLESPNPYEKYVVFYIRAGSSTNAKHGRDQS